jgi:hypothetical protein
MDSVWLTLATLAARIAELEREVADLKAAVEKVRAQQRGSAAKPASVDVTALIS